MRQRKRLAKLNALLLEDRTVPSDFSNPAPISIAFGPSNPNPSPVVVSGLTGQQITKLQVLFNNLSHSAPDNIDAELVAPNGTRVYLISDAGGGPDQPVNGATLTFADAGVSLTTGPIATGTYKPTNLDQGDPDTIPGAPTSPPPVLTLAAFQGIDPNGTWNLWINGDDSPFDGGSMANGWTLRLDARANSAPVAVADTYTTNEDTTLTTSTLANPFGVLHNDTDADTDPLTAQLVTGPSHGKLTFNADGTFAYVPKANFNGTDSFTYKAYDGTAYSNVATATITVNAVNDVPVANDDTLTVQSNGPQTVHKAVLMANDIDPDVTYRATIYANGFEGLATQKFNGTYGGAGADGTDWGEIPTGWTRDNTTSPTPTPNDPTTPGAEFFGWHPMDIDSWISQQGDQARSQFTKGGPTTRGTVLVADGDAYADFVGIDTNKYTTLLTTPPIPLDGINQDSLRLEFDSSYRPEDPGTSFARVYASFDGGAFTQLSEFSTDNTPGGVGSLYHVNEHLVYDLDNAVGAKTVQFRWGYEQAGNDWWWAIDNLKVTGDRTDPAQATIEIQSQPGQGSVALDANGAVVYTPPTPDFTGTTSFTYRLNDGAATSNTATVNLTVNANTAAPVAVNDTYSTLQAVPLTVQYDQSVLANDADADLTGGNVGLKAVLMAGPTAAQGTVTFKADGTFKFTPNAAFFGNATFTYKVNDGTTDSNTATVTIGVTQNNFATPVANDDSYSVNNNGTLTVPAATGVLANDTDADNNPLTAFATKGPNNLVIGPDHGTLTFNPDGSFTYVPRPFYNGPDSFTYRAFDGALFSNTAKVSITVNAVNVPPKANPDSYFTPAGTPLTVSAPGVLANDRDDGPKTQLFFENFDSLPLIPFNTGTTTKGDGTDWTDSLPAGWVRDNTTTPPPSSGTAPGAEFFGWNAMDADSWSAQQGNQARSDFTRGGAGFHGTVLVTDGDAYDDFVGIGGGKLNTLLVTPSIPLGSITPNSLELEFDSSFRPEDPPPANQHGRIEVSYDDGANWTTLLDLTPANSGGAGSRIRTNEHLTLDANNPAGATAAKFRFSYLEAGNDWWWAIDNVKAVGSTANAGASMKAALVAAPPAEEGTVALNTDGSFTFTPAAGFTGLSTFTYKANDGTFDSDPTTVNVRVGPQAKVQVDDGTAQRSMVRSLTVTFAGTATFVGNNPTAAFTLVDATATAVPFSVATTTVNGNTVATITFTGGDVVGGSLVDGRYTLTVLSTQVTIGGQPLDGDGDGVPGGDLATQFFRFFGDVNGDAAVNGFDYGQFRLAFGSVTGDAAYRSDLDFNGDGAINGLDFGQFRTRFGNTLP